MNLFLRKLLGMNWLLAAIAVALSIFGVIAIYSVTFMREEAYLQEMWRRQVDLNCIPYYMFVARNTGSKYFFELPLEKCWQIYRKAYSKVSGVCRTVRGPSMSTYAGKIQILGVSEINKEKHFVLRFLQGRNPDWIGRPFFAKYDPEATWFTQLKPSFGEEQFFFEKEYQGLKYLNKYDTYFYLE